MIKKPFNKKVIAIFLTLNFLTSILPLNQIYANNNGPNAPEASGFEPVNATDMVNLSSGDMSYVLPLLEVDGFPVTLSYHAGIPMDMEASWVGLGWNINTGAIARGVVANPDDWGIGRRLNLTYLYGEIDSYSVNVGVGIAKAAEVGVGLSWGSNKSISGSVSASVGGVSASIDTNGNYSVGVSSGIFNKPGESSKSPFGGGLSLSGNVKKGGLSANIGVGGSEGGISMGMGVSISSNGLGTSYSVGAGNVKGSGKNTTGSSAGSGISMNSFSAGDYSYNTKGFYVPINIGIINFGFGFSKTKITLAKGYNKYGYGVLYHNYNNGSSLNSLYNSNLGDDFLPVGYTGDYQRRNTYGDVYEQSLPQTEEEFIGDYRNQIEKLNFTYAGYDSYDINASGIGGALRPIIGENSVLIGEGYDGESIRVNKDKTKVYYHNSNANMKPHKGVDKNETDINKLNYSFEGQITEDAIVDSNSLINSDYNGTSLNLSNFINSSNTLSSRPKSGSFVQVYTNEQIDAGADILLPSSIKSANTTRFDAGYMPEGIGGYKITTPDGKTYHFAQPVYHYEQVQHNFLNFDASNVSKYNSSSKREATPYATHWLLTAITGPDYIDVNNNNFADENDYGYWLRLDHGQWSNAFTWRSPYDTKKYTDDDSLQLDGLLGKQSKKHYSTYIDKEASKADPGYFIQGRKDLYYLDQIVSKNQSAIFVKDIRHDAYGTEADYVYNPTDSQFNDPIEGENTILSRELAVYDKEYQLRLEKIIIVNKNESEILIDKTIGNNIDGVSEYITNNDRYFPNGFFDKELPEATKIHKLHMHDNIIDVNDLDGFDYSQASKVIKFNHSYDLARKTPSSGYVNDSNGNYPLYPDNNIVNAYYGRLTLESVKTYGRGTIPNATENDLYDYMPPYEFEYKHESAEHEENYLEELPPDPQSLFYNQVFQNLFPNSDPPKEYKLVRANKDNWGFRNGNLKDSQGNEILDSNNQPINTVDGWSLNKITTPQGGTIEIEYEEDDFYIEAFGRKYWENNLQFKIQRNPDNYNLLINIQNHYRVNPDYHTNFLNYFELGEEVFLDLYICRRRNPHGSSSDKGRIDINSETYEYLNEKPKVLSVDEDNLILEINNIPSVANVIGGNDPNRVFNRFFAKHNSDGSHLYKGTRRECPTDVPNGGDHHKMTYKLLSNKVAPGTSGGGLRVKDIIVNDDLGNKYITRYDYNDPETGKTSGITSFNPITGEVFVPYQNELPGPGVMYEWVTMKAIEVDENNNEKEVGKTRYNYYTLQPVFDIFNPNIDMKDVDDQSIFKTEVVEVPMTYEKTTAKDIRVEKNLTKIGQLISIEEYNEKNQLISKTKNSYSPRVGEISETFSSMKSVFDFNENDDHDQVDFDLKQRYISLSTKSEKVSVVKEIETTTITGISKVTYDDPDPYLGTYTTSLKTLADGSQIKEKKIPAYTKYPELGSKVENPNNRNMLTQEAMSVSSVKIGSQWKTLNANITTWNKDWIYRDYQGNESSPSLNAEKIWRKHKSYVWKEAIQPTYGYYETTVDENNDYFNWGVGVPSNNKWQKASEITRYTHWSSPIETKDINGNYASSKMAENDSKVIAGGNAKYTEMYYSGAENPVDDTYFEGEIKGVTYISSEQAHTGENSLYLYNTSQKGFRIQGDVAENNAKFRPGKYKVSFWAYSKNNKTPYETYLKNGSEIIPLNEKEIITAGDWTQLNYYVDLEANTLVDIYITMKNDSGSNQNSHYFDDFRMYPVYASMNSYVYDSKTDELTYILDANNLATKFVYDKAGRLCKTYKEVANDLGFIGGFKLTNQYKYNYKGISGEDCDCCDEAQPETASATNTQPLTVDLRQEDEGMYTRMFAVNTSGGSGNYSYQWRWLTDANTESYSDYISSEEKQLVPFTPQFCDENSYDKLWLVEVKVTDNITGEITNQKEEVILKGCKFKVGGEKWADLEVSSNYESCEASTKYTFRPFVVKPEHNNYSFYYQVYDFNANSWSSDIQITNNKNVFCPAYKLLQTGNCKSGLMKFYSIKYKAINNESGDIYFSNVIDVYSECHDGSVNESLILPSSEQHEKYGEFGNILEKDANGKIINLTNFLK